jgi:hypothetical protein
MRPTLFIGIAALATLVAVPALADGTVGVSAGNGSVTFSAPSGMHMNNKYPWKIKDASGTPVKKLDKGDFSFDDKNGETPKWAKVALVAGTLSGGYCDNDPNAKNAGCHVFHADCTASTCTIKSE